MKTIGLLISNKRSFGIKVCCGIMDFARKAGDWALRSLDFEEVGKSARFRACDGYIASVFDERMARSLRKSGKPTVDVFGHTAHFPVSEHDAELIGQLAARHFIEHRFTHFAFFGYEGLGFSNARRDAFVRSLKADHFPCDVYQSTDSDIVDFMKNANDDHNDISIRNRRNVRTWVKGLPKPVGVFCAHDLRAFQLIDICLENKIRVPEDVAVLGVDNDEFICNFSEPPISSIDQDGLKIGFSAAELLSQMLAQPGAVPASVRIQPFGLVERGSTCVYPLDPPWLSDALIFIRGNIAKGLSAADVYAHLGMSHSSVDRAFRKVLGSSVQKTIMASRLDEAKRLITTTDLPMSEISALSGFASVQYFCKSFTGAFGRNPSSFR